MNKTHHYHTRLEWTGNKGTGTESYKSYERSFQVQASQKPIIAGSSDPAFRGDKTKYNPEELLVASLSSCHLLWYLHLCADAGVIVTEYMDTAIGEMQEDPDGSGRFSKVILHPVVTVRDEDMVAKAHELHAVAHRLCFIANSMNFPVEHVPEIITASN